ncbi:MAG TPA: aminotransferase class IV [Gemmatimonadales bacterium]|nr:aminotransferase class IV [Gemmatimonadales bacterium]
MSDFVYFGGGVVPRERATLSVDDRGFLFADAVYEVIRVVDGRFVEAQRHLARLARSLRETSLPALAFDPVEIATDLLRRNGLTQGQGTVYLQVSRGVAARQHAFPPPDTPPTVLMTVSRFSPRPELWADGAAAISLPDLRWSRCDIKSVNLLANVMAAQRAWEAGAYEAILLRDGVVTEATRSNVAAVVDGVLRTHPTGPLILPGVTRELVLELARAATIPVREEPVRAEELFAAEEVVITGTTADVMPIVAIDGRPVGAGRPGPVSRRLGALLAERIGAPVLAS